MALQESDRLVIFGITGDLAKKMTLPSLYRLERRKLLKVPVVTVASQPWTQEHLVAHARECIEKAEGQIDELVFARLAKRLSYVGGDFLDPDLYTKLKKAIGKAKAPTYYLEIPPPLFAQVAEQLYAAGMTSGDARIVFEKPFGTSLDTAVQLNAKLHTMVREEQIFRIDHYLGKEPVLDVVFFRFANQIFEPIWNSHYVDCIMVTMAEDFGVADRGSFYDAVGTIRDVVQNHLLQVISLVTMEAPVRDMTGPRLSIFRAIPDAQTQYMVKGQYEGYQEVPGVKPRSKTETFVALKLNIHNWRWGGTPVFIRAGKNLPVKATEVVVRFKKLNPIFIGGRMRTSRWHDDIVFRLGSDPGVSIDIRVKTPGRNDVEPVMLGVDFLKALGSDAPEPYELLLTSAMGGDHTLFPNQSVEEETWRIVQPLLDDKSTPTKYKKGSWGPQEAQDMVKAHGGWREPTCDT